MIGKCWAEMWRVHAAEQFVVRLLIGQKSKPHPRTTCWSCLIVSPDPVTVNWLEVVASGWFLPEQLRSYRTGVLNSVHEQQKKNAL